MQGTTPVELGEVLTWPQALVGALIVIVVMGLPQLFTYLNGKAIKKQVTNNSGSSMKDAVDRIETNVAGIEKNQSEHRSLLDDHLKISQERDAKVDERIVRLETLFEYAVVRKGEIDGGSTGSSGQG